MPGFDRFTDGAQDAVTRAYEVMMRHEHSQLDTEHIVIALLEQEEGIVHTVLQGLRVDTEALKQRLEDVLKAGSRTATAGGPRPQQVYITPRVKRLMDRSNEEAVSLGDEFISTEHLMLAVLSDGDSAAVRILNETGVTHKAFSEELKRARKAEAREPSQRATWKTLEKYSRDLTQAAREAYWIRLSAVMKRRSCACCRCFPAEPRTTGPHRRGRRGQDGHRRGARAKIATGDVPEKSTEQAYPVAGSPGRWSQAPGSEENSGVSRVCSRRSKAQGEIILFIDERTPSWERVPRRRHRCFEHDEAGPGPGRTSVRRRYHAG